MKASKKTPEKLVAHFQKRCQERLGYILTQKFLKEEMRNGGLEFIEKVSNSRTVFKLPRKWDDDYYIVYDKPRNTFVTVYRKGE